MTKDYNVEVVGVQTLLVEDASSKKEAEEIAIETLDHGSFDIQQATATEIKDDTKTDKS